MRFSLTVAVIMFIFGFAVLGIVLLVTSEDNIPDPTAPPPEITGPGSGIMDEIAASFNPNAEWVGGRAICKLGFTGPICSEPE